LPKAPFDAGGFLAIMQFANHGKASAYFAQAKIDRRFNP
jgi:hypothetical protein